MTNNVIDIFTKKPITEERFPRLKPRIACTCGGQAFHVGEELNALQCLTCGTVHGVDEGISV